MRLGARVWKTALAVTVAIAVCRLLGLEHPVFAGVAAIICMQPTIAGSLRKGLERMQATIIGAAFSLLALIALSEFPLLQTVRPATVGLTVLLVMAVTIYLGWLDSLVLAAATVVVIMVLPPDENIYVYAGTRTVVTFVGIVVATVTNAVFFRPRYQGPLWESVGEFVGATDKVYRRAVEAFCSRNLALALEARESLSYSDGLVGSVATAMQWVEEEAGLHKKMRIPCGREVEPLSRAVVLVTEVRRAADNILRVTAEVLERAPEYSQHPAPVYDTLLELAHPSFELLDRIMTALSGGESSAEPPPSYTREHHMRFIKAIRDGHAQVFPLVETSVVEFEIRKATDMLAELERIIEHLTTCPR